MTEAPVTWERMIPDKFDRNVTLQRNVLDQHLERYQFAGKFVKGRRVLDAACGVGYGAEILLKAGAEAVIGLDIDTEAVDYARQRYGAPGIEFVLDDLEECDLAQWDVSVVTSFETVEHLRDPGGFLTRIRQILPADGLCIASVPVTPTVDINEFHLHDFTEESWRQLVTASGFDISEELTQRYAASLAEVKEEMAAPNTISGSRSNQGLYYLLHPLQAIRRCYRALTRGIELDMLTVAATPRG